MSTLHDRLGQILIASSVDAARLNDGEARALLGLIDAARERQQEYLRSGLDDTMDQLPRVVRGAARKIVFGR